MRNFDDMKFFTPPECQGQIVLVSYALGCDEIVRRTYDQSERSESYAVAELDWPADDPRWAEWETYNTGNGEPPWSLDWIAVDESGRALSTLYTYTIYDSDPARSSGNAWPAHTDVEIEADSAEEAIERVQEEMAAEAAGLNVSDGYEVGQVLHALVWSHDGTVVGTLTHALTAEDVGASKDDVTNWETVASYVATFPTNDGEGACDVEVQVGSCGGAWFARTSDDAGGDDGYSDTQYATRDAAVEAAEAFAEKHNEADPGQDAEDYLREQLEDVAGEPDPDGEYCVYWETALDDAGPRARYATREQAKARAELLQSELLAHNPGGNLLCGYGVRELVDGEWVDVDERDER